MTHYEIDEVKWRVAEMLGDSFSLYSADEIAELEAALRTDDPEELQRIHDKWAQRPTIDATTLSWRFSYGTRPTTDGQRGRPDARAGVDVYDQPTGAPHHYLWISPLGRPRLTSCEAPGSSPPKWGPIGALMCERPYRVKPGGRWAYTY